MEPVCLAHLVPALVKRMVRRAQLQQLLLDQARYLALGLLHGQLAAALDGQVQLALALRRRLAGGHVRAAHGQTGLRVLANLGQCLLGRHLPARLLREIVDLQLLLVLAEHRVGRRRRRHAGGVLLLRLIVELAVQLGGQLLGNGFRLRTQ